MLPISAKPRVGMIGLGLMGSGMAANLASKGFPLTILGHRNRQAVEDVLSFGACEAGSVAELARASDIVLLCLPGSNEVDDVCQRLGGLLATTTYGSIVVDCSTSRPSSTRRLAALFADRGVQFVDAPLTRTPKEAREGRLNCIVAGADGVYTRIEPVLRSFSENLFRAGDVGNAHTIKLINNLLSIGMAALAAEGISTAIAAGVNLTLLRDLVSQGGANSSPFQGLMNWHLTSDKEALAFSLKNARKDIAYFLEFAEQSDCPTSIGTAVATIIDGAIHLLGGSATLPGLLEYLAAPRSHGG